MYELETITIYIDNFPIIFRDGAIYTLNFTFNTHILSKLYITKVNLT